MKKIKMKIFIGQAVSGENIETLKKECSMIQSTLEGVGNKTYCTINPKDNIDERTAKDWLVHAFEEIDEHDTFLAIIRSEKKSEGMLMEIGYALSKNKKLIVAIKKDVRNKTYVDELADEVIEFDNIEDLCKKLEKLK